MNTIVFAMEAQYRGEAPRKLPAKTAKWGFFGWVHVLHTADGPQKKQLEVG